MVSAIDSTNSAALAESLASAVSSAESTVSSAASAAEAAAVSTISSAAPSDAASTAAAESQGFCAWVQDVISQCWTAISNFFASLFGSSETEAASTQSSALSTASAAIEGNGYAGLLGLVSNPDIGSDVVLTYYNNLVTVEQRNALDGEIYNVSRGDAADAALLDANDWPQARNFFLANPKHAVVVQALTNMIPAVAASTASSAESVESVVSSVASVASSAESVASAASSADSVASA